MDASSHLTTLLDQKTRNLNIEMCVCARTRMPCDFVLVYICIRCNHFLFISYNIRHILSQILIYSTISAEREN